MDSSDFFNGLSVITFILLVILVLYLKCRHLCDDVTKVKQAWQQRSTLDPQQDINQGENIPNNQRPTIDQNCNDTVNYEVESGTVEQRRENLPPSNAKKIQAPKI